MERGCEVVRWVRMDGMAIRVQGDEGTSRTHQNGHVHGENCSRLIERRAVIFFRRPSFFYCILTPRRLREIIVEAVTDRIDDDVYQETLEREETLRNELIEQAKGF